MAIFDWNAAIPNLPQDWRQTEGRGVKVAVIDTGALLFNDTLRHLNVDGHKFHIGRPDYSLSDALSATGGNDNINDQATTSGFHGTACLSVLAGKPESATTGVKGVAPQAEVFILKTINSDNLHLKGAILQAIELALAKNCDIIVCPVLPTFEDGFTDGLNDEVMAKLSAAGTILVSTTFNTTRLSKLTFMEYPSNQAAAIVTGVAQVPILATNPSVAEVFEKINFLVPPTTVGAYRHGEPIPALSQCSSSFATMALAGVIALIMSNLQRKPSRSELISLLEGTFQSPFQPLAMIQRQQPAFSHA